MNRIKIFSVTLGVLGLAGLALAVEINTNIPTPPGGQAATGLGGFVNNFYTFALMISGVLAFGAIVYGGIKYILAAGNPSGQQEGKEWIKGALIGLLLLAGAYTILNIINPNITTLALPKLVGVQISASQTTTLCAGVCGGGDGTCDGYCPLSATGKTQTCQLVSAESLQRQCYESTAGVACSGHTNGACASGQTCVNQGDTLNSNWQCVANTTFTCGGDPPNSHFGDCPPPNVNGCYNANGGTSTLTIRWACSSI